MSGPSFTLLLLVVYLVVRDVSSQSEGKGVRNGCEVGRNRSHGSCDARCLTFCLDTSECKVSRPRPVLTFSPWPTPLPPRTPTVQFHSFAPTGTESVGTTPSLPPVVRPQTTPTTTPAMGTLPPIISVNPPTENATTAAPTKPNCVHNAQAVEYHRFDDIVVQQPDRVPIDIMNQTGSQVTFNVYQAWKQSDTLSWVATEYKDPVFGWTCSKKEHAPYGPMSSFTAACDADGWTQIKLYAYDSTFPRASVVHPVPSYCSPTADDSKTVAYYYKVPCVPECNPPIPSVCTVASELYHSVGSQAFNSTPIEVVLKNSTSVTFRVLQTWVNQPICTMATYYPSAANGVACDRIDAVKPGLGGKYTAACQGGTAFVTVYVHDTTFDPLINKAKIPSLCNVDASDRIASYTFLLPCTTPSEDCILPSNISCQSGIDHVAAFEDFESGQSRSWTFGVETYSPVYGRLLGPFSANRQEAFKVFTVPTAPPLVDLEFNIFQSGGWVSGDKMYLRLRSQYMELLSFLGALQSRSGSFGDIKVNVQSRALKNNSSVTGIFQPFTMYHVQARIPQRWYTDGHLMIGFKVDLSAGNTTRLRTAAFDDAKITSVCDPTTLSIP